MEVKYLSRLNAFWRHSLKHKGPFFPRKNVYVEAHRGGKGLEPENTMRAFQNAIALGCDSIELDVWLTKDKKPVVIHGLDDGDISKTTNGKGKVIDKMYSEILKYDAGKGERIPALEDVIKLCKGKMWINIEIKPMQSHEAVFKVVELIEQYDLFDGCNVSSFDHRFLQLAEDLTRGKLEIGYLYDSSKDTPLPSIDYITSHGHTANICFLDARPELGMELHKKGMGFMAWTTSAIAQESTYYQKVLDADADILCVNYPNLLQKHLAKTHPFPKL